MNNKLRILVAPLDWGIGHSTRCVPIIRELLRQGAEVYIASNGRPLKVLQREFPQLPSLTLPRYDVKYPFRSIMLNMLLQLPRLLWAIFAEHRMGDRWVRHYGLDGIITDNRLGCFSRRVPTVFITHQVHLKAPDENIARFTNRINHSFMRRFGRCWIPDWDNAQNLSGTLSRPSAHPKTVYTGPLTRLQPLRAEIRYDALVLLSGPEPQRTYVEKAILKQAAGLPYKMLLVQGKPETDQAIEGPENVQIVPFLDAPELSRAIAESRMVVCRSGYSTVMDLAVLGKRALYIPTPGQTEQEYLAEYLNEKGASLWQSQQDIRLSEGIAGVLALPEPDMSLVNTRLLEMAVRDFLIAASSSEDQMSWVPA